MFAKTTHTGHTGINTLTEDEVLVGIISKESSHETVDGPDIWKDDIHRGIGIH